MIQNVFFMLGHANSSMFPSFKEKSISSTSGPLFLFLSIFLSFFRSFFLSFALSFFLSFFLSSLSLSLCILRFLCVSLSLSLSIFSSSFMFSISSFFDYIFFWGSLICPSLSLSLSLSPRSPCPFLLSTHPSLQQCPFILGSACVSVFFSLSVSSPLNARIQPFSAEDPWSCASKGLEAALKGVPAKTMLGILPWTALLRKGKHRLESSLTLLSSNNMNYLEGTFVRACQWWRRSLKTSHPSCLSRHSFVTIR